MSEYSVGWPLWTAHEQLAAPEDLSLSASLADDLRAWQDLFEREFHRDGGWHTAEAEACYARAAPDLLHRLRRELGADVHVTLDAWPVSAPELVAWLRHRAERHGD